MSYRSDLDALAARASALEAEVDVKTRERDAAKRLLDEARVGASLPVFDHMRRASRCSEEWSRMVGVGRVRACTGCKRHVYDLGGMTRDDAERLIVETEGRLCARYFQRADGSVLLRDCPVGKRRRAWWIAVAACFVLVAGLGWTAHRVRSEPSNTAKMMVKFAMLRDEMCQCRDPACAEHVSDEMASWAQTIPWHESDKPTEAELKVGAEISRTMTDCLQRAMTAPRLPRESKGP